MAYTYTQLKQVLAQVHNPDLAKQEGMVAQIWSDGEITYQKAGELLWQRNLHCIEAACVPSTPPHLWPIKHRVGDKTFGYAFVTSEDARVVRDMLKDMEPWGGSTEAHTM